MESAFFAAVWHPLEIVTESILEVKVSACVVVVAFGVSALFFDAGREGSFQSHLVAFFFIL